MIKIIADKQTKLYELTYLLPGDFTESQLVAVGESVAKLITKSKGEVLKIEDWGKRELAYKIRHQGKFQRSATYAHLVIKLFPNQVQAFEKALFLEEDIMRHLVVVSDNQDDKKIIDSANLPGEKKVKNEDR